MYIYAKIFTRRLPTSLAESDPPFGNSCGFTGTTRMYLCKYDGRIRILLTPVCSTLVRNTRTLTSAAITYRRRACVTWFTFGRRWRSLACRRPPSVHSLDGRQPLWLVFSCPRSHSTWVTSALKRWRRPEREWVRAAQRRQQTGFRR